MPFSFIDIETKKSRRIIFLFLLLLVFYFVGAVFVYVAFKSGLRYDLVVHSRWYRNTQSYYQPQILPSTQTLLLILGIAFLATLIHWISSTRKMIPRILSLLRAKPVDTQDLYHSLFKNIVEEVSVATGGKQIEPYVVSSHYLNAFALADFKGRWIIGATEGLLIKMNRRQLEAAVAHEASHLIWGDCLMATVSCSISAIYSGLFKKILQSSRRTYGTYGRSRRFGGLSFIFLFLAIAFMHLLTLLIKCWISREREHRADATAVRLTRDPLSLAEALYLISRGWRGGGLPVEELSPIFIVNPLRKKLDEKTGLIANLFSTHPPIKKRMDILLDMGHSDLRVLESSVKKRRRKQAEISISSAEEQKLWYVHGEGNWQGPFTLAHLSNLKWLRPDTWIKVEGDQKVKPAYEYKEINNIFKKYSQAGQGNSNCPACHQGLEKVYYEGVLIQKCCFCGGRLVKKNQVHCIIVREEMQFTEEVKKMVNLIKS